MNVTSGSRHTRESEREGRNEGTKGRNEGTKGKEKSRTEQQNENDNDGLGNTQNHIQMRIESLYRNRRWANASTREQEQYESPIERNNGE